QPCDEPCHSAQQQAANTTDEHQDPYGDGRARHLGPSCSGSSEGVRRVAAVTLGARCVLARGRVLVIGGRCARLLTAGSPVARVLTALVRIVRGLLRLHGDLHRIENGPTDVPYPCALENTAHRPTQCSLVEPRVIFLSPGHRPTREFRWLCSGLGQAPTSGIVLTQEFLLLRAHLVGEVLVEFAQCAPVLAHPT